MDIPFSWQRCLFWWEFELPSSDGHGSLRMHQRCSLSLCRKGRLHWEFRQRLDMKLPMPGTHLEHVLLVDRHMNLVARVTANFFIVLCTDQMGTAFCMWATCIPRSSTSRDERNNLGPAFFWEESGPSSIEKNWTGPSLTNVPKSLLAFCIAAGRGGLYNWAWMSSYFGAHFEHDKFRGSLTTSSLQPKI